MRTNPGIGLAMSSYAFDAQSGETCATSAAGEQRPNDRNAHHLTHPITSMQIWGSVGVVNLF